MPREFTVKKRISPEPMSAAEEAQVEELLARFIAQAYLADHHPELLEPGDVPTGTSHPNGAPTSPDRTPRVQRPGNERRADRHA